MRNDPQTGQRTIAGGAFHRDERQEGHLRTSSGDLPPLIVHPCPHTLHRTRTGSLSHTMLLHDGHLLGRSSPPTHTFPQTLQVRLTVRGASHLVLLHSGHL